jgi:hypothetical protein
LEGEPFQVTEPQPVERIFGRSWELLNRNWVIIVPGLLIGAIVGIVGALVTPPSPAPGAGPSLAYALARASSGVVLAIVALIGFIATQAYTTGMAGAAWERGRAALSDGAASFQEDAGRILITGIGLVLLAIVAAILALPTIGISLLAFYVFTLYAMPSAILGNRPGFSSIAESFRIAGHRFGSTFAIAIVILVVRVVFEFIAGFFAFAPLLGPIIAACITQAVVAYATLVVVGEYLNLTAAGAIAPPRPPVEPAV